MSIAEFDELAQRLYTDTDPAARADAGRRLESMSDPGPRAPQQPLLGHAVYEGVLSSSGSQYSLLYVAQAFPIWFKENLASMTPEARARLMQSCFTSVRRVMAANAPRHVVLSALLMYAKMTKLGFDREPYLLPAVALAVDLFRATSVDDQEHCLAVLLLTTLNNTFCRHDNSKVQTFLSYPAHRRTNSNYRDECLLEVFQCALTDLGRVDRGSTYVAEVVELAASCMGYDFMAIMFDETDEPLPAQVPASWRETLLLPRTQDIIWGQQAALPLPYCATLLASMANLCGIRRTFFDTPEDRQRYLDMVLERLIAAAQVTDGRFADPAYVATYLECCWRLIPPFGYRDLRQSALFPQWLSATKAIALDVIAIPFGRDGSFNTTTAALHFWSRLTTARRQFVDMPEDDSAGAEAMDSIPAELALRFLQSRVNVGGDGGNNNNNNGGDALDGDDEGMDAILAQCDALATTAQLGTTRVMEQMALYLQNSVGAAVLQRPSATMWLFFIAASMVHFTMSNIETSSVDACTAFFTFSVDCANQRRLDAAAATDTGPASLYGNAVERGLLAFLTQMQAVLTLNRLVNPAKVVSNIFGTRASFFQFILTNVGQNMMRGVADGSDTETALIIKQSIDLIGDACRDTPAEILAQLTFDLPPVVELPLSQSPLTFKLRTNLYAALWAIRAGQRTNYHEAVLLRFLEPIQACLRATVSGGATGAPFVAGWLRDLRGVARAVRADVQSNAPFIDVVTWFCDNAASLHHLLSMPVAREPMVAVAFLRFLIELVDCQNGGRYDTFSTHTAMGLVLFKHLTELIGRLLSVCVTEEAVRAYMGPSSGDALHEAAYPRVLKPLALSMRCLSKCIRGSFVPFEAMRYYGDRTYDDFLTGLLTTAAVFSYHQVKAFPKVCFELAEVLRVVTEENVFVPLAELGPQRIESLLYFCFQLCESLDTESRTLTAALQFLGFVASLIKEAKTLTESPQPLGRQRTPPPLSPMQLPSMYAAGGGGTGDGTPGAPSNSFLSATPNRGGSAGGGAVDGLARAQLVNPSFSLNRARDQLALLLEPLPQLWSRLIATAMSVVVHQDRCVSMCCNVVFPILDTHPPFWHAFCDGFVAEYPQHKQPALREALSELMHNGSGSRNRLFSELCSFRQKCRSL